MPKMTVNEFIKKVIGVKWVDRASTFKKMDCWGLVILYYRHVLKIELATIIGYETSQATPRYKMTHLVKHNVTGYPAVKSIMQSFLPM
ncbi:hypothetical protein [Frischella perrara]|uniref:hypothetical protein n=1 Tax=Frischella perrara TaxID=1267021 RepID=UPI0023F25213|nr:hypothetical protein [Frischella perrara]